MKKNLSTILATIAALNLASMAILTTPVLADNTIDATPIVATQPEIADTVPEIEVLPITPAVPDVSEDSQPLIEIEPLVTIAGQCGADLAWYIKDDTLTISGTGAMYNYSSQNPAPWTAHKDKFTKLDIQEGVTIIGNFAFADLKNVTGDLVIPNSVTKIYANAFIRSSGFDGTITLSENLETIGNNAFSQCTNLTGGLDFPDTLTSIGNGAFIDCKGLSGTLDFPEGLTFIGNNAFSNIAGFTGDLIIPNSVTYLGTGAFLKNTGLNGKLVLSENLTVISGSAFNGCTGLVGEVHIPEGVTRINNSAFSNCTGLTGLVSIPNTVTVIEKNAFFNSKVQDIYYRGNETEWANVSLTLNSLPRNATVYFNQDIEATAKDVDGNVLEATFTGLGEYEIGDTITISAPKKDGYKFVGWEQKGVIVDSNLKYTFTVEKNTEPFVAVYEAYPTATVTITGTEYTVNGVTEAVTEHTIGDTVTLVAQNDNFSHWEDENSIVLSTEQTYSFVQAGDIQITKVDHERIEGEGTVVFVSDFGQEKARFTVDVNDILSIEVPSVPDRLGYTTLGWNKTLDQVKAEVEAHIVAGTDPVVTVTPMYEEMETTYTVTVTNGEGSGEYLLTEYASLSPNKAPEGQKFSHWVDETGRILSYNPTFKFFVSAPITVSAVYVEDETQVEKQAKTAIVDIKDGSSLAFVSEHSVPQGYKILRAGVLANREIMTEELTEATKQYMLGGSSKSTSYRYTLSTKNKTDFTVRSFLKYQDTNGNIVTIYGDTAYYNATK